MVGKQCVQRICDPNEISVTGTSVASVAYGTVSTQIQRPREKAGHAHTYARQKSNSSLLTTASTRRQLQTSAWVGRTFLFHHAVCCCRISNFDEEPARQRFYYF